MPEKIFDGNFDGL